MKYRAQFLEQGQGTQIPSRYWDFDADVDDRAIDKATKAAQIKQLRLGWVFELDAASTPVRLIR